MRRTLLSRTDLIERINPFQYTHLSAGATHSRQCPTIGESLESTVLCAEQVKGGELVSHGERGNGKADEEVTPLPSLPKSDDKNFIGFGESVRRTGGATGSHS